MSNEALVINEAEVSCEAEVSPSSMQSGPSKHLEHLHVKAMASILLKCTV